MTGSHSSGFGWKCAIVLGAIVSVALAPCTASADLSDLVELPRFSEELPFDLGTLPAADQATCTIKILNAMAQGSVSANGYRADKSGDTWNIIADRSPGAPVATLKFSGDHLMFQWTPGLARPLAGGLRNRLLHVTYGGKMSDKPEEKVEPKVKIITLRKPVIGTGNVLELERDTDTFNPEVEDLPETDALTLELFGLSNYEGPITYNPVNKRANLKQPVAMILKPVPPQQMQQQQGVPLVVTPGMQLNVTLTKLGPSLLLEVRPLAIAGGGTHTHSLTLKVLNTEVNKTRIQLGSAKIKLTNDEKLFVQLEQKLALMNKPTNRTAKQKTAFDASVSKVQGQLSADKQKIDVLRKQVATLQGQQDTLPELLKIATSLHENAAVQFRVLYAIDKYFIVLFATEKAPTDAPQPMN